MTHSPEAQSRPRREHAFTQDTLPAEDVSWETIERVFTACPVCKLTVFGAAGRGYCKECSITFALPGRSRKEIIAEFLVRYYMSRNSPHYHRAGCRYIRNIEPENLIVVTVPLGKPCQCVR